MTTPADDTKQHQRLAKAWVNTWFEKPSNPRAMRVRYLPQASRQESSGMLFGANFTNMSFALDGSWCSSFPSNWVLCFTRHEILRELDVNQ